MRKNKSLEEKTFKYNPIDVDTYYHVIKIFLSIHYAPACIINSTLEHPVAVLQALQWVPPAAAALSTVQNFAIGKLHFQSLYVLQGQPDIIGKFKGP